MSIANAGPAGFNSKGLPSASLLLRQRSSRHHHLPSGGKGVLRVRETGVDIARTCWPTLSSRSCRRIACYTSPRVALVPDGNVHSTSTAYDFDGQATAVTDALSHSTLYAYDMMGQVTKVTDAANRVTTMAYDAKGQLTAQIDGVGRTTSFTTRMAAKPTSRIPTTFPCPWRWEPRTSTCQGSTCNTSSAV